MSALSPLLALLLALAVFCGGYWAGYSRADAARLAEVAELERGYAEAYAEAQRQARAALEEETRRGAVISASLIEARQALLDRTKDINRRINDAARSAAGCTFGPDFVELYNHALGYPGGGALPASAHPAGAGDDPAAPASAGPGILAGQPVTPADLLAHARDYGAWARGLEAQARGLAELAGEGR